MLEELNYSKGILNDELFEKDKMGFPKYLFNYS